MSASNVAQTAGRRKRASVFSLVFISLLAGTLLGLHFRFFILVPALMFTWVFVTGIGVASEAGVWWMVLDGVVASPTLQLGYFAGCALLVISSILALQSSADPTSLGRC